MLFQKRAAPPDPPTKHPATRMAQQLSHFFQTMTHMCLAVWHKKQLMVILCSRLRPSILFVPFMQVNSHVHHHSWKNWWVHAVPQAAQYAVLVAVFGRLHTGQLLPTACHCLLVHELPVCCCRCDVNSIASTVYLDLVFDLLYLLL